jgi:hypothetical protein
MIVLTFINGVLDVNIINTAIVCIAITTITAVVYFVGALIVSFAGAVLSG